MNKVDRTRTFKGFSVAGGVSVGKARWMSARLFPTEVPRQNIPEGDISREIERFQAASEQAAKDLEELAEEVEQELGRGEADLIRPQAMMARDPSFMSEVEEQIAEELSNAEAAVADVIERFERMIGSVDDNYLRERSADVRDAGRRILGRLLFTDGEMMPRLTEPSIVVSEHLIPSLTVHLDRDKILGFATEKGGYTSHAAILARSLGVPAVSGLEGIENEGVDGHQIIVDGLEGSVILNPGEERLQQYERQAKKFWSKRREVIEEAQQPAVTTDDVEITVQANIGRPEEAERVREYQARGVGLYRTEFEYLSQTSLPSEENLRNRYESVAEEMGEDGVVFRLLDIGGDKFPPAVPLAHEENPFLGLRGLRLLLRHEEDIVLPQLKAMMHAARKGTVRILYPMVASPEDLDSMLDLAARARREVEDETGEEVPDVDHGVMVEVPSSVHMLPVLLDRCDFASVGTNDLVQYILAADRNSERMAGAYDPYSPAVLWALRFVHQVAERKGKEVSVCGEVAGDTHFLPLLLGMGYRKVSVNVGAVPYVKRAVRQISMDDCRELAEKALDADVSSAVHTLVDDFYELRLQDSTSLLGEEQE